MFKIFSWTHSVILLFYSPWPVLIDFIIRQIGKLRYPVRDDQVPQAAAYPLPLILPALLLPPVYYWS